MELFVPSLLVLIFSAVIIFGVIPRVTPLIIFIITVVFFVLAVYSHYLLFKYEYTTSAWRDTLAKSIPAVVGTAIAIGLLVATLNIFTNIKITPPKFSFFETKPQSIVKGYSNIPIEKIIELEKQL